MTISSLGGATSAYPLTPNPQSPRSLFQQLASDIKSGDLTAAQSDFTKLQGFFANAAASASSSTAASATSATSSTSSVTAPASTSDSLSTDIANLSSALQSGDQNSVQAAFQKFAAAARGALGGGHMHHHRGGPPPASTDSSDATSSSTDPFQQWLDSSLASGGSTSSTAGSSSTSGTSATSNSTSVAGIDVRA